MAKMIVEEQKEFSLLPVDSILLLKVDELSEKEVTTNGRDWTKLEIKFKILQVIATGDGSPLHEYEDQLAGPIWGSVPLRLTEHPENKLRLWAEAILGIEMGVGFELDTDVFVGREVKGITSQYDKRATDPKTGKPFKGHQVASLLPKGPAAPQQQQWQQPQGQQQDPWAAPQQQMQPPQPQTVGADPWSTPGQGQFGDDEPPF
jgi:hypothetical protein